MFQELTKATWYAAETKNSMDLLVKSSTLRTKFCEKRKEIEKKIKQY